jgi:uncharacterized protein YlxW (UPF0749 family)
VIERPPASDFLTEMFRNPLDAGYAEAARRRAERGPDSTRRRLVGRAARGVVLVATGFLLMVAYHQTVAGRPEVSKVRAGLVTDVRDRQHETDLLQQQADQLRDEVSRQRDAALAAAGHDGEELNRLELATGTGKVYGPGTVVRLADAAPPLDPVTGKPTGKNLGVVLDRDLQRVTNELWYDGAEAISINGERLSAVSTIRTAGSTILVDFRPISSPYEVTAIGPEDLDQRFARSRTGQLFRAIASQYGMQVSVDRVGEVTMPAAPDPQLHYAEPVPSVEPTPGQAPSTPASGRPGSPVPSSPGAHSSAGGH